MTRTSLSRRANDIRVWARWLIAMVDRESEAERFGAVTTRDAQKNRGGRI